MQWVDVKWLHQKGHAVSPGSLGMFALGECSCLVWLPRDYHATETTWGAVIDSLSCVLSSSCRTKMPSMWTKLLWTLEASPSTSWVPLNEWPSSMRWRPEELFTWDLTYVIRAIWLDGCCWKPLSFGAVCCYTTIVAATLQSGRCVRSDASSPLLIVRKTVIKNSGWLWGRAACHGDSSSETVKSQIEIKFQPIRLRVKKIQPGRLCGGGRCREPVNESLNSLLAWLNWPHSLIST